MKIRILLNGVLLVCMLAGGFHALIALWPAVDPTEPPASATPAADVGQDPAGAVASEAAAATPLPESTATPDDEAPDRDQESAAGTAQVKLFNSFTWQPSAASALLVLVAVAGAVGSLLHTANSFAVHVAMRDFDKSWQWWYLLRPLIGSGLALVTYLLVRGQLLGLSQTDADLNPYGTAGLAALVGLFSRQAMIKLGQMADTLFAQDRRPAPSIERVDPPEIPADSDAQVEILGQGFVPGLTVAVDGTGIPPTDVTETSVTMIIPEALAKAGQRVIVMTNPSGASATTRQLTVT